MHYIEMIWGLLVTKFCLSARVRRGGEAIAYLANDLHRGLNGLSGQPGDEWPKAGLVGIEPVAPIRRVHPGAQ